MNRVGLKHIALNRFPLKHARDFLSLAQILVRGDVVYQEPLSFKKRLECIRFYFSADGIRRLQVAPGRAGSRWLQLGVALALDVANGGDGEYDFENEVFYPRDGLTCQRLDWRVPTGAAEKMHARTGGPTLSRSSPLGSIFMTRKRRSTPSKIREFHPAGWPTASPRPPLIQTATWRHCITGRERSPRSCGIRSGPARRKETGTSFQHSRLTEPFGLDSEWTANHPLSLQLLAT